METAGQVQVELRMIPLGDLLASVTNPRKEFGKEGLSELAESLKASGGAIEPLIVRPFEKQFEIVAGERRFRAAKLAKLETLACLVRELSDEQAIEMQLVENLQREDLSPIEEGQAYRTLMEKTKQTAEQVGAKVGKSRRYVYARMKLCDLIPEAAKLVADGTLSASHGDLLGRLPAKDQKVLLKDVVWKGYGGGPVKVAPVEQVERTLKEKIYRELDSVPFPKADAELVPSAGACTVCPKNSTVNPDLVVGGKAGRCTDRGCFEKKLDAWVAVQGVLARQEFGREAVRLLGNNHYREVKDAVQYYNWYQKVVEKTACASVEAGVIVAGADLGQIKFLCRDAKCKKHAKKPSVWSLGQASASYRANNENYKNQQKIRERVEALTVEAVLRKVAKPGPAEVQCILEYVMDGAEHNVGKGSGERILDALGCSGFETAKIPGDQKLRAAYALSLLSYGSLGSEAKRLKVDVKAIEKQVKAELAAEKKAKAKPSDAKALEGKPSDAPKAQGGKPAKVHAPQNPKGAGVPASARKKGGKKR